MRMYKTRKEKRMDRCARKTNQDVHYEDMIRNCEVSEKAKKAFRHKPYTIIHAKRNDVKGDR